MDEYIYPRMSDVYVCIDIRLFCVCYQNYIYIYITGKYNYFVFKHFITKVYTYIYPVLDILYLNLHRRCMCLCAHLNY